MDRANGIIPLISVLVLTIGFMGCKQSMVISKVDYSQPIEAVLEPNEEGMVNDVQHGIQFSILPLQHAETDDTSSVSVNQIRMIRGKEGFYYITASGFNNVYVMAPENSKLKLKNKITISDQGIEEPAFNQRNSFVQLVDRGTGKSYALTVKGINEEDSNEMKKDTK